MFSSSKLASVHSRELSQSLWPLDLLNPLKSLSHLVSQCDFSVWEAFNFSCIVVGVIIVTYQAMAEGEKDLLLIHTLTLSPFPVSW